MASQIQRLATVIHVLCFLTVGLLKAFPVRFNGCMARANDTEEMMRLELLDPRNEEEEYEYLEMQKRQTRQSGIRSLMGDFSGMTINQCVQRCWSKSFDYAALQVGRRCFCGTSLKHLTEVNSSLCYNHCMGNCRQRCGGTIALSVFLTGYEQDPAYTKYDLNKALVGCFAKKDVSQKHKGRQPVLFSPRMTPSMCITHCLSHSHFYSPISSFEDNSRCVCFSKLEIINNGRVRRPHQQYCTLPCSGGPPTPGCFGLDFGNRVVAVFNAERVGYSKSGRRPGRLNYDQLRPVWEGNDNFEHEEYKPLYVSPDDKSDNETLVETVVINSTSAEVVGESDDEGRVVLMVAGIILSCVLLAVGIMGTVFHLRNRSPKHFKLPDQKKLISKYTGKSDASYGMTKSIKRKTKGKERSRSTNRQTRPKDNIPRSKKNAGRSKRRRQPSKEKRQQPVGRRGRSREKTRRPELAMRGRSREKKGRSEKSKSRDRSRNNPVVVIGSNWNDSPKTDYYWPDGHLPDSCWMSTDSDTSRTALLL